MDQSTNVRREAWYAAGEALLAYLSPRIGVQPAQLAGPAALDPVGDGSAARVYEEMRLTCAGPLAAILAEGSRPADRAVSLEERAHLVMLFMESCGPRALAELYGAEPRTIERAYAATELLLRAHWGSVRRVAEWLTSCGCLQADQVRGAIESAPPEVLIGEPESLLECVAAAAGDPQLEAASALLAS